MILIDETYFKGELSLPNIPLSSSDEVSSGVALALQSVGEKDLSIFVDKYVVDYLIRLVGRELTETFLTEIAKEIPGEIWSNLKKQLLIEIRRYKASPLANYVYYWLMRDARTKTTQGGETDPKFDNAENVNNNQKMVKAWNEMVRMTCIIQKWYCENIEVYKEYIGCQTGRNVCSITQHINTYNLL